MSNLIYPTPLDFTIATNHIYPPGNFEIFEEYFYKRFMNESFDLEYCYLPVQWTSYYISKDYCNNSLFELQIFLDLLPRSLKYFTVVQWDDGIVNDLSDLDLLVFSSGGKGSYPIPLISQPYLLKNSHKDIFCSFMGSIKGRHKIREKIEELYSFDDLFFISEKENFESFTEIMSKSLFSLCPRGYGKTSFRICEALSMGSIPVYIYDDPWIPFYDLVPFETYGVLIHESELKNLKKILLSYSEEELINLQKMGSSIYNKYYSYAGCFENIINLLRK